MKFSKGFTLIEVLVGTALMLIVFLGIFGAYQLGIKVVGQSKNRVIATAVATAEIEKIKNLPYDSIGVQGSFPDGILEESSEVIQSNVNFKIERRVDFVVDAADGIALPEDECPNDYKKLEIKVSWTGLFGGSTILGTDIAPKNLNEECAEPGGILSVSVFDAYGVMVSSPQIEVKYSLTDDTFKNATPDDGKYYFSLPASTYKVVVSKEGYSTERTYGTEEITTPEKSHPIIIEDRLIEASFSIDKLSNLSIDTLFPGGEGYFSDSFTDGTKIFESSNVSVSDGQVNLMEIEGEYSPSGYLISTVIAPESLIKWKEFSFNDNIPTDTQILYQVLYFSDGDLVLIPDTDLPGNSAGFGVSPIDLSNLNITDYSQLRLKGNLSTQNSFFSPYLYEWQISWTEAILIPNVTFHLRGNKIIGSDGKGDSVYKYSQDKISNSSGHIDISNLEWDFYTFSIDPETDLDLINIDPSPQPINLPPDSSLDIKLYFDSENSFLITAQNIETLLPIFSAAVRLSNSGLAYDVTQYTNDKGQTYFIPLEIATYNLEIQAPGYSSYSGEVLVSGDEIKIIKLEQIE